MSEQQPTASTSEETGVSAPKFKFLPYASKEQFVEALTPKLLNGYKLLLDQKKAQIKQYQAGDLISLKKKRDLIDEFKKGIKHADNIRLLCTQPYRTTVEVINSTFKDELITPYEEWMKDVVKEISADEKRLKQIEIDRLKELERKEKEERAAKERAERERTALLAEMQKWGEEAIEKLNKAMTNEELALVKIDYIDAVPEKFKVETETIQKIVDAIKVAGRMRVAFLKELRSNPAAVQTQAPDVTVSDIVHEAETETMEFQEDMDSVSTGVEMAQAEQLVNTTITKKRRTWDFRLQKTIREVHRDFMCIDEEKVKQYIKDNKDELEAALENSPDGVSFNGLTFYKKESEF